MASLSLFLLFSSKCTSQCDANLYRLVNYSISLLLVLEEERVLILISKEEENRFAIQLFIVR